jgi:hypothetical protein
MNRPRIESGNVSVGEVLIAVKAGRLFAFSSKMKPFPVRNPPPSTPPDGSIFLFIPPTSSRIATTVVAF